MVEWKSLKICSNTSSEDVDFTSLVPRLPWNVNIHRAESLVSFQCKHDVIKIGPEQKGNILHVVQPTMSSTLGVYDIQSPIARYM